MRSAVDISGRTCSRLSQPRENSFSLPLPQLVKKQMVSTNVVTSGRNCRQPINYTRNWVPGRGQADAGGEACGVQMVAGFTRR
eukprot:COSAG04_NODE_9317_length_875_cov_1.181701_2_plen_83_part_00